MNNSMYPISKDQGSLDRLLYRQMQRISNDPRLASAFFTDGRRQSMETKSSMADKSARAANLASSSIDQNDTRRSCFTQRNT